jgi:hypothetical protein
MAWNNDEYLNKKIINEPLEYKLKLIFLSGTCLLILLKYMENLEYSGQKKLRKSILACNVIEGNEICFRVKYDKEFCVFMILLFYA